jgi:hypothetical protein
MKSLLKHVRFVLLALAACAAIADAQSGTISGSVVDASTLSSLARVAVSLTPANGEGLLSSPRDASPFGFARTTLTGARGEYQFADLPIGTYRLYIRRVGYLPTSIEVQLGEAAATSVSVGLVVAPIRLRAVEVRGVYEAAETREGDASVREAARAEAARARQREFLSTDTRELTHGDIDDAATTGGRDVLRALQRLPGVSQFDDWSAKIWIRGSTWEQSRLYYDGLPLFDPLAALGRTSGVSADAIGGAFLHPGVRPVSIGGEGAARVDLRSLSAMGHSKPWTSVELSRLGASATVARERADSTAGFILSAQHTLHPWFGQGEFFENTFGSAAFSDGQLAWRSDARLDARSHLETSALLTRDRRRNQGFDQEWGNVLGRVTLRALLGPVATAHTVGVSRFSSSATRWWTYQADLSSPSTVGAQSVTSDVDYVTFGERALLATAAGTTQGGYDLIAQQAHLRGPRQVQFWGNVSLDTFTRRGRLAYSSVWAEHRLPLGDRAVIDGGVRLDLGGRNGLDRVRPQGSLQSRITLAPGTLLSFGASRTRQYVQGTPLPDVAGTTTPTLWMMSGADVPAAVIDNAMTGIERWIGSDVLIAANAYARRTRGSIAPDPIPGLLIETRPIFVSANESAHGLEISARKLAGRMTGLVAYSYGKATTNALERSFPSTADRTHAFDATTRVRFGSVGVGGAYTLTSGAPFTRITITPVTPTVPMNRFIHGEPNAQRLPAFSSFDLSLDYTRRVRAVTFSGFATIQNLFNRTNSTWYVLSGFCSDDFTAPNNSGACAGNDFLDSPVKLLPTFGVRAVF